MRVFLLVTFTLNLLFGNHDFKETRYIDALQMDQSKYGNMKLENNQLHLIYTNPIKEEIIYEEEKLVIIKDENINEYFFIEYPTLRFMGLILKYIITDNYLQLDNFFDVKITNDLVVLEAKPVIYNIVESIEIVKRDDKLRKIIMNMTNKDIITIETIN